MDSSRIDAFPAGLRVLVVDDDPTWLKILEKMLKKCSYEVTTCCLAREALDLLRERKNGYDIVISDVNMPDMDGFKLLEHVGLEMDLPVIMMSVDGETSRVMKGVQHGACDYLLKPIRMKELRNIWQHVFRKRIHEHDGFEEIQMMRNGSDYSDDAYLFSGTNLSSGRKRKDDDKEYSDTSSAKKARVVWSIELHQKFVKAVNHIGFDKVGPKKILDLMNVPRLTRENVASHLQKYRLYLSRLQKENELKASFGGVNRKVLSPRDPPGNACLQNLLNLQQNDVRTGMIQNVDSKVLEGGAKGVVSMPIADSTKAPSGDTNASKKTSNAKMGFNHSYQSPKSEITFAATASQHLWHAEYSQTQFRQESNAHIHVENKFNHLPLSRPHVDFKQSSPSFVFRPISNKGNELAEIAVKPSYVKSQTQGITKASQAESEVRERNLTKHHSFERNPPAISTVKSDCLDQVLSSNLESAQINGASLGKDSLGYSPPHDFQPLNIDLENLESFDYNDPELLAAIPHSIYESLKYDYEYPFDSIEYPVMDQSLFIV